MRTVFGVIAILLLSACVTLGYLFFNEQSRIARSALADAQEDASSAAASIEAHLQNIKTKAESLAGDLTTQNIDTASIKESLQNLLQDRSLYSIAVEFAPENHQQGMDFYATRSVDAVSHESISIEHLRSSDEKAHDKNKRQWLQETIQENTGLWQNPQYSEDSSTLVCGYSTPIRKGEQVIGAVSLSYNINELHRIMRNVHIWHSGFGLIFDPHGQLIYHPNSSLIISDITRFCTGSVCAKQYPIIYQLAQLNTTTPPEIVTVQDKDGRKAWSIQKPINATQWHLSLVFFQDEILFESSRQGLLLRWLTIACVLCLFSFTLCMTLHVGISRRSLWFLSCAHTLIFLAGSLIIWDQSMHSRSTDHIIKDKIKNQSDITALKQNTIEQSQKLRLEKPIFIPTGTLVRSVNFTSANDVVVNGYIWQQYQLSDIEGEKPILPQQGVTFVEAFEDDIDLSADESDYTSIENGTKTFVWYFKITLRQKFSYDQFPFDHEAVWLRLRYIAAKRNVVLVPDLDAYNLVYESACPGIDPNDFILPGWTLEGSYFTSQQGNDNVNFFDFRHPAALGNTPEYMFNISIKRNFIDPFVSNITPLIIIFTILFIIIMTSTRDEPQAARFGFSSYPAVALIAALLFSMMYLHTSLRSNLSSASITYFEYFYILGYLVMILVAINSAILTSQRENRFIWHHRYGNLFPQLSYWPLAAGVMFFITAWKLQF